MIVSISPCIKITSDQLLEVYIVGGSLLHFHLLVYFHIL